MKSAAITLLFAVFCLPALAFQGTNANSSSEAGAQQADSMRAAHDKAIKLNVLITEANQALDAKDWQKVAGLTQEMIAIEPNRWQFYQGLGDAQLNLKNYEAAVQSYGKGVEIAERDTGVDPKDPSTDPQKKKLGITHMLMGEGSAYAKLNKAAEAIVAYKRAAVADPDPARGWFNVCAIQYNMGNVEGALESCDTAITLDPTRADAYFIRGSLLLASGKADAAGRLQPPPGTQEALEQYLKLAPQGKHAVDVREMLKFIGAKVETTYQGKK